LYTTEGASKCAQSTPLRAGQNFPSAIFGKKYSAEQGSIFEFVFLEPKIPVCSKNTTQKSPIRK
jgi:hypothetical protein